MTAKENVSIDSQYKLKQLKMNAYRKRAIFKGKQAGVKGVNLGFTEKLMSFTENSNFT